MLTEMLIQIILILAAIFIVVSPGVLLVLIIRQLYIRNKRKYDTPQEYYQEHMDLGPYGTGWTWNEKTKLWEPPKADGPPMKILKKEPTYEKWKEMREKSKQAPKEEKTSTYSFVGSQIPKDDTIINKKSVEKEYNPMSAEQTKSYQEWDRQFWTEKRPEEEQPAPPKVEYRETVKTKVQRQQPTRPTAEKRVEPKPVHKPIPNERTADFQDGYQAANILTANERYNYKNLKIAADKKGYIICPKVRLADIVVPRKERQTKSYMARFGKIKSKHVDFVIYDCDMRYPKAVIELDDKSHEREDRKERDEFVDFILNDCGIRVIHTYNITPDILDDV